MKFNIQMFADTVTASQELKIDFSFQDGDTRIVTIPNPKSGITTSEIEELATWTATNQPILGDKAAASNTGISQAYILETSRRKLDLS